MGQQLLTDFTAWSGQGFAQAAATFFGLWAKLAEGAGSFIYILLLLTSGTPGDKKWIALIWSAVILYNSGKPLVKVPSAQTALFGPRLNRLFWSQIRREPWGTLIKLGGAEGI